MAAITQERTARKQHECFRCPHPIQPGERYMRQALPPHDNDIGNEHWWVLCAHLDDNYLCLASSGRL
jgi:hypothetical protein